LTLASNVAALETWYFEYAISEAMRQNQIETSDPGATSISLRATIEGILGRARVLNRPDELDGLLALGSFWQNPAGSQNATDLRASAKFWRDSTDRSERFNLARILERQPLRS
jgi:hypothetical protein